MVYYFSFVILFILPFSDYVKQTLLWKTCKGCFIPFQIPPPLSPPLLLPPPLLSPPPPPPLLLLPLPPPPLFSTVDLKGNEDKILRSDC